MRRIISSVKKTVQIKTRDILALTQTMEYITSALWKSRDREVTYSLILSRNKEVARAAAAVLELEIIIASLCQAGTQSKLAQRLETNKTQTWRAVELWRR